MLEHYAHVNILYFTALLDRARITLLPGLTVSLSQKGVKQSQPCSMQSSHQVQHARL